MTSDFLQQLSDSQREAAQNYNGAALIIAGAGSGKTRVLTYRIAHMIRQGVRPYSILALTFTNKAASEMRERIAKVVDKEKADMIWMGTFHSIFARILRKEAEHLGFTSNFSIYDSADSQNLIKNIIKEKNLNDEKYKPRTVASRISLAKNNLITPAAYAQKSTLIAEDREIGIPQFLDVYKEYMVRCRSNNAMDFDDLLLYTNILFRDKEEVLATYQKKFTYILVDEYQDTNMAQYLIIKKIAEMFGNIAVVGDDAQSIYSFRGAKIENILKFQQDYPNSKTYKLEQNYRSTQTIVNAANSVIEKNSNRLKKVSFSKGNVGDKIKVYKLYTDKEEAANVANDIKLAMREGDKNYKDFAILYRTNAQSRTFEEALRTRSIPYRIYGGFSFYQRTEIKNMLAYARVLVNSSDNEALLRIINFPARGLGDVTLARISEYASYASITVYDTLIKIAHGEIAIKGVAQNKIAAFMQIMENLSKSVAIKDAYESMYEIAYATGIVNLYKETKTIENQSALQNIEELLNSLKQISDQKAKDNEEPISLGEWLESVVLITSDTEDKNSDDKITLMTIHSAKGLEFDTVFIVGMEEGLFPLEGSAGSLADIEEERRLFYVAITRAVNKLTISLCQNRYKWGKSVNSTPSRFMQEIDSDYLEIDDCEDQYSNVISRAFSASTSNEPTTERKPYNPIKKAMPIAGRTHVSYEQRTTGDNVDMSKFKRVKTPSTMRDGGSVNQSGDIADIKVGNRVEHAKFGIGVVVALEPTSTDTKATIEFSNIGKKTLLLKFAKLKNV